MGKAPRSRLRARRLELRPYVSLREMGRRCGVYARTVHRWEVGENDPFQRQREAIARGYEWPEDGLGQLLERDDELSAEMISTAIDVVPAWQDDDVDRREFIGSAFASAAFGHLPLSRTDSRVGMADVTRLRTEANALYLLDDQAGGDPSYRAALDMRENVRWLLRSASYTDAVGRDLQVINGQLTEHAGWSAYDAGRHDDARRYLNEALVIAQMANSEHLATTVTGSMALMEATAGSAADALALANAAKRTARPFGTRRLESLLCAREAMAHARFGDATSCTRALVRAEVMLDDHGDDDEDWLTFWGPADLFWHGALACLALADLGEAERVARQAVEHADPAYKRNGGLYLAVLATTLFERGALDEAAATATEALPDASHVASGRLCSDLGALRHRLAEHSSLDEASRYVAAYDAASLAC